MRKSSTYPTKIFWIILSACLVSVVVINACRKIDSKASKPKDESSIRKQFFTVKPGTDPIITAIAGSIKRQDAKRNFVSTLVKKAGYAIWDKAKVSTGSPTGNQTGGRPTSLEEQVFIPFVMEDSIQTKALLVAKISNTDTFFHMLYGAQYSQFEFDTAATDGDLSAQNIFELFIQFDYDIFGHTKFRVTDSRLLPDPLAYGVAITSVTESQNRTTTPHPIIVYTSYIQWGCCTMYGARGQANQSATVDLPTCGEDERVCNATLYTRSRYAWVDDDDDSWEWGNAVGGDDGGAPCPGCNWEDTNPCVVDENNVAMGICNEFWSPIPDAVAEVFDPNQADSVYVDNYIRDSLPCIYHLIKDTLYNTFINVTAQNALQNFFTVNVKTHIYFAISPMLDCYSPENAITSPVASIQEINGIRHWIDTIYLNPCFLVTASKEAVLAVLLHEPIHAYINWCVDQYQQASPPGSGIVDSAYLVNHFGIFWQKMINSPYDHSYQHDLMIANYIDTMSNIIYSHYNSAAPDALKRWVSDRLAAGGLFKYSSAWGAAPGVTDTCNIHAVNYWGRYYRGLNPQDPYDIGSGCRTFSSAFRDSLQMIRADSCQ